MRPAARLILAIIAVCCLLPVVAAAQPQPNTLRDELERTDRILERAREQVGVSVSGRAGTILTQAVRLQSEAWTSFRANEPRKAFTLTHKARDLARNALETAEIDVKAHESIRDLVESTKDLMEEAIPVVRERNDPQARRLLDVGAAQLQRAMEAYRGRQYRKAISLAATARDLVQRALDRARQDSTAGPATVASALDRTQALLEEVRFGLQETPNPKAQALYDEALRFQQRAREQDRAGQVNLALGLTTHARESALEALLLLSNEPNRDDVGRAVSVVEQLILDLTPEILSSGSSEAKTLLDSARQRHAEASQSLAKGDLSAAMSNARIAEGLLRRAAEAAGMR